MAKAREWIATIVRRKWTESKIYAIDFVIEWERESARAWVTNTKYNKIELSGTTTTTKTIVVRRRRRK